MEHNALPRSLDQLVPQYLPTLPSDPFSDGPFGYRVSNGEFLTQAELSPVHVMRRPMLGSAAIAACLAFPAGGVGNAPLEHFIHQPESNFGGGATIRLGDSGSRPDVHVPPGTALLWSVGPDMKDQGGRNPLMVGVSVNEPGDWVFLVPARFGE